jgi:hypothetical protein
MKHFKLRSSLILLVGLGIGYAGSRTAQAFVADKTWAASQANYTFSFQFPTGQMRNRVHEGANAWTNVASSSWTWNFSNRSPGGEVWYTILDGNGGLAAVTNTFLRDGDTHVQTFEMVVDIAESWNIGTGAPSPSQLDMLSVLTHEFGHAAWADHSDAACTPTSGPTMCAGITAGTTNKRSLEADDRNGLASVYP